MTIDEKLDLIIKLLQSGAATGKSAGASNRVEAASDADLDSERGNPQVRKDPKGWKGASFVGCNYTECTPEYLDALASDLEGLASWLDKKGQAGEMDQSGKYPVDGKWKRKDASRARGWAARKRAGWVDNAQAQVPFDDASDMPF